MESREIRGWTIRHGFSWLIVSDQLCQRLSLDPEVSGLDHHHLRVECGTKSPPRQGEVCTTRFTRFLVELETWISRNTSTSQHVSICSTAALRWASKVGDGACMWWNIRDTGGHHDGLGAPDMTKFNNCNDITVTEGCYYWSHIECCLVQIFKYWLTPLDQCVDSQAAGRTFRFKWNAVKHSQRAGTRESEFLSFRRHKALDCDPEGRSQVANTVIVKSYFWARLNLSLLGKLKRFGL